MRSCRRVNGAWLGRGKKEGRHEAAQVERDDVSRWEWEMELR